MGGIGDEPGLYRQSNYRSKTWFNVAIHALSLLQGYLNVRGHVSANVRRVACLGLSVCYWLASAHWIQARYTIWYVFDFMPSLEKRFSFLGYQLTLSFR